MVGGFGIFAAIFLNHSSPVFKCQIGLFKFGKVRFDPALDFVGAGFFGEGGEDNTFFKTRNPHL